MNPVRKRLATAVTALVGGALLSGCSIYDVPLPGGPDTGDKPMAVKVMFRDVLDLVPQSTVKVNDISVGKVKAVELKGYVAEVTMELPGDVDLPDNATAQIRQTSLLGEKFVSLAPPSEPSSDKLSSGDVIGLDRTGRNPEVEEVLGALSLLLNGGGVGQLKTIAEELNIALDGRTDDVKSVLDQIRVFVGQLDANKGSIVAALENTNRLAAELRRQDKTIKAALDDVPDALASINRQRDDLVKLLAALNRLSGVGVRVIQASKESTINSLRDLAPVLEGFAKAGQNFPKAFQVFLTYPFVDEAVGRDPQVARNLHMGDYTNLSVNLDLKVDDLLGELPGLPSDVCDELAVVRQQVRDRAAEAAERIVKPLRDGGAPDQVVDPIEENLRDSIIERFLAQAEAQCRAPRLARMLQFGRGELQNVIDDLPQTLQDLLDSSGVGGVVDDVVGGVTGVIPGLPRAALGEGYALPESIDPFDLASRGLDPGIGTMLLQGVAEVR